MLFFNIKFLIEYSGLLITFASIAFGVLFQSDIYAFVHRTHTPPPAPSQEPETTTPLEAESPRLRIINDQKPVHFDDGSLSIICEEDEMVDIEKEFESPTTVKETIDTSYIIGLFEAIETQNFQIPGQELVRSIRSLMHQTYFNAFFKIENDAMFKKKLNDILRKIELAQSSDNLRYHIGECYQLFRSNEYKRINYALDNPMAQSPFTALI
jgi:hypothetical protein